MKYLKPKFNLKILMLLVAMFVFYLALALNANAVAPTLTLITTTWGTDTMINVTFTGAGSPNGTNITHLGISFSATNTANSTASLVCNITNNTATNFMGGSANCSFGNHIVLEDSSIGYATAITLGTGGNNLSNGVTMTSTSVIVDREKPTQPTTSHKDGDSFGGGSTVTYTVTDSQTTECRISFGRPQYYGSTTYAMTYSGSTCTYIVSSGNPPDNTYDVYATASDGLNSTISKKVTMQVDTLEEDTPYIGDGIQIDIGKKVAQNQGLFLLLLIIVVFLILKKKK